MSRLDAWSRRKAQVAEAEAAEARAASRAATEAAMADKSDAEICAALDLPDPDRMGPGDDFAAFLKKDVPERLRRVALRKLWLSDPSLANVDGLVDYGEDFTMGTAPGEVLATAYKVGKGFAARAAHPAEADLAEAPEEAPPHESHEALAQDAEPVAEITQEPQQAPEDLATPAPRRMRFEFADQENDLA